MKKLRDYTGKPLQDCTILELYNAALALTQEACADRGYNSGKKKVYYISAEFLIGKLLSNNLINLGIYDDVKAELAEAGKDITELEEFEYEPSPITAACSSSPSRTASSTRDRITGASGVWPTG